MPDNGRVEVHGGAVFVYLPGVTDPTAMGMEYAVRALLAYGPLREAVRQTLPRFIELRRYREVREGTAHAQDFPECEQQLRAALALAEKGGA